MLSLRFRNYLDMKRKLTILIACIVVIFVAMPTSDAQNINLNSIREKGPMFVTSLGFSHGFVRIPYTPRGEETSTEPEILKAGLPAVSISQFMGYQFNPYLCLGIGVGFDYWTVKNAYVPIYVDFRVNMMKTKFAPVWYINLGYSNRWFISSKPYKSTTGNGSDYIIHGSKSGLMGETGFGVKVNVKYSTALNVFVFAKFQESALRYYNGSAALSQSMKPILVDTDQSCVYISLGVKAGITF